MTNDYKYIAYIDKDDTLHLEHNGNLIDIIRSIMTQITAVYSYLYKYNNSELAKDFELNLLNFIPALCKSTIENEVTEVSYNIINDDGTIVTLSEDAISMLQFLQDSHEENDENL